MASISRETTATFNNRCGQHIFYRSWTTAQAPKGIVLIVHGLNSHSGYYQNFAGRLNENRYEVYAIDLRGCGHSDGRRHYVSDYYEWIADINLLLKIATNVHFDVPVFLFGHGTGGLFAAIYTVLYEPDLKGLICESIALKIPASGGVSAAIKLLSMIAPEAKLFRFNNGDFSRDPSVVRQMDNDFLLEKQKQPLKTIQQLLLAAEYLEKEMVAINLPILVLHGTADRIAKPGVSEYLVKHISSADKQLKLYEGYYHDLLNDKCNEMIIRDILGWLDERATVTIDFYPPTNTSTLDQYQ